MTSTFTGGPGFLAFVVTFALVAGAIVLFRSLSAHLRKVRTHPPQEQQESAVLEDDQSAGDEVADEAGDR